MIHRVIFFLGIIFLIVLEIARVYFIMPFPGSQKDETIQLAYFIGNNIFLFRLLGLAFVGYPAFQIWKQGGRIVKWAGLGVIVLWLVIVYLFNFRFLADKMFYQPQTVAFAPKDDNKIPTYQLVLGVTVNAHSKAYPIEMIGYHHQVRDSVGGVPVMVTYCTVCRTGRVFSPVVDGQPENFRLVGMDHFNAMFEDSKTKSWWRQVNGEVVAGPLKGKSLSEIPSEQMRLGAWLALHPDSEVMQPDSLFLEEYDNMKNYDEGKSEGTLTKPDSLSWKDKSWVVGVPLGLHARAYDWKELQQSRLVNDVLGDMPILIVIENDSASFHTFLRDTLTFRWDPGKNELTDVNTQSLWTWQGACVEGKLAGSKLQVTQSYQEFWHSWKTFHPQTTEYHPEQ